MLPNNQEAKKKKGVKEFFSLFKTKKKDKSINISDSLSKVEDASISETQESFSSKTLEKKSVSNKKIILIGSTGSGKSALANVISRTSKFRENESSTSVTREVQEGEFTENGINYVAIDTVGIGDTQLKREEVLDKLADAVYLAREGINQVFFVVSGRFDKHEIANYNLLKSIIFDETVASHTTVIRTNFPDFEKINECEEDKKSLLAQNEELRKIIKECNGIIHVDNPSLEVKAPKNESDERRKFRENKIEERKLTRSKSRDILLKHLKQVCQNQEFSYQPPKLKELSTEIFAYMEEKIRKRKELAKKLEKERQIKVLEEKQKKKEEEKLNDGATTPELKSIIEGKIKELKEVNKKLKTELSNKLQNSENDRSNPKLIIKLRISSLENEIKELTSIKELKEGIQKADEQIRQVLFNHIFNNINDIAKVTGAEDFLNSLAKDNDNSTSKLSIAELREKRKELETKLLEKKDSDQSLEELKKEIDEKYEEILKQKKELLNDEEVLAKWQEHSFNLQQSREWADILKTTFDPENDASFCAWLRDDKKLTVGSEKLLVNIKQLREEYDDYLKESTTGRSINSQEWLEKNYPNKEVNEVYINQQLEGVLDCSEYKRLKEIFISSLVDSSRFEIKKGSYLGRKTKIIPCIFAQEWLDQNYPKNGTRIRKNESKYVDNFGKKRVEIKKLDISEKGLEGNLDLSDFNNLEELDCRSNKLASLNVAGCFKLKKIDCSNNPFQELDLSTCLGLEEVNIKNCLNLVEEKIKSHLTYDAELGKLMRGSQIRWARDNGVRNILIIGITGNGKSALAGLLANTDRFELSNLSTSVTKGFKAVEFEENDIKYRVIDNIGFGDTNNISEEDIFLEIGEGIYSAQEGINQVLFVFGGRFGPEQIAAFNTFKRFFSESSITKFTTLVRTNFPSFRDEKVCERDKRSLLSEDNKDLRETIESCNGIIYVDNPPILEIDEEEADSDDEEERKQIIEKKEVSRKIVLDHLAKNCPSIYKFEKWDGIYARVAEYIEKRNKIEQSDSLTKAEDLKKIKKEVVKDIKDGLSAELSTFRKLTLTIEQITKK